MTKPKHSSTNQPNGHWVRDGALTDWGRTQLRALAQRYARDPAATAGTLLQHVPTRCRGVARGSATAYLAVARRG